MPADLPAIDWPMIADAVWWNLTGTDEFSKDVFDTPLQIRCRWDEDEEEIQLPNGDKYVSNAQVIVDRRMKIGDALRRGPISELSLDTSLLLLPYRQTGYKIMQFSVTPSSDGEEALYLAYL